MWLPRRWRFPRTPDFIVGDSSDPYLERWYLLPRNSLFNVYLHHFRHSDDDRALHDHPYHNVSVLMRGSYIEHLANGKQVVRLEGSWVFRKADEPHRVELFGRTDTDVDGHKVSVPEEVWTLFITGPRIREWGFHCANGWVHFKQFLAQNGCGED